VDAVRLGPQPADLGAEVGQTMNAWATTIDHPGSAPVDGMATTRRARQAGRLVIHWVDHEEVVPLPRRGFGKCGGIRDISSVGRDCGVNGLGPRPYWGQDGSTIRPVRDANPTYAGKGADKTDCPHISTGKPFRALAEFILSSKR